MPKLLKLADCILNREWFIEGQLYGILYSLPARKCQAWSVKWVLSAQEATLHTPPPSPAPAPALAPPNKSLYIQQQQQMWPSKNMYKGL